MRRNALPIAALCLLLSAVCPALANEAVGPLAERILAAAGSRKGLCVDVACGSGELAAAIAEGSDMVVHALETDDARVAAARRTLMKTGLYANRVAVEKSTPARLPYPDACANLIVRGDLFADGDRGMSFREVLRVLRPGGLAFLGRPAGGKRTAAELRAELARAGATDFEITTEGGLWAMIRRKPPAGIAQWSHGPHGSPTNNAVAEDDRVKAPFQTLWIGGPRSFTKYGLPLLSEGRVLLRHGGITHDSRWKFPKEGDLIQASDAYNGLPLWQMRLPELAGDGFVAVGPHVYAAAGQTLYILDAATGAIRRKVKPATIAADMKDFASYAAADGVLVVALYEEVRDFKQHREGRAKKVLAGLSADGANVLWTRRAEGGFGSIVIGGGLVFTTDSGTIHALRLAGGKPKWQAANRRAGGLRLHRGRLYTNAGTYAAADGTLVGSTRFRGLLIGDRCYGGSLKGLSVTDLNTGRGVSGLAIPRDPYCPKTGIPDGCRYMYGRCIMRTGSTHCFFFSYSGTAVLDLTRGEVFPAEAFRSNCRTGVIAANGLMYTSPSGCACALAVRGGAMLTPVDEALYWARPASKPPAQLEKGPAYSENIPAAPDADDDWPAYRRDAARSNVTAARIAGPLAKQWLTKLGGALTPPAVAGGIVFAGSMNHSVYALDAATGRRRWRFTTGGEIHVTPACWNGRVYAGSQDGWVYCLRAADGELIWRFRGGEHDRKMIYRGRVQSLWPIGGGVIAENGVVHFYAGYCSHDRVFVYALDAATGRVIWKNEKAGRAVEVTGPAGGISPSGVSPGGPLVASKDILYVPHGMFAPSAFDRKTGRLLWWGRRGDSTERSNINVQNHGGPNLSLGGGVLFVGGPNRLTGTRQPYTAVDAKTGRFWGADDPALFQKAGRDKTGKSVILARSMFGTYPIKFGGGIAPVVVDGGVFIQGWRGGFKDLNACLRRQFGPVSEKMEKWSHRVPSGTFIVTADSVLACSGAALTALRRTDGAPLWTAKLTGAEGECIPNGLAAAAGRVVAVTNRSEVVCLGK